MADNRRRDAATIKGLIAGVLVVAVALAIAALIALGVWLWAASHRQTETLRAQVTLPNAD